MNKIKCNKCNKLYSIIRFVLIDIENSSVKTYESCFKCRNGIVNDNKSTNKIICETKKCSKCDEILLSSLFFKNDNSLDGLGCWCKKCNYKYNIKWRKTSENSKKYNREYARKYYHRVIKPKKLDEIK